MKSLHLTLRLPPFHRGRKGFADGFSVDLASQTEVRAVTGLVGLMTTTVWLSTTAVDGSDGAAAKITQLQDLHEDAGTLLFEGGEGVRQRASPIRTYIYVRIISTKKENCRTAPSVSLTHYLSVNFEAKRLPLTSSPKHMMDTRWYSRSAKSMRNSGTNRSSLRISGRGKPCWAIKAHSASYALMIRRVPARSVCWKRWKSSDCKSKWT